MTDKEIIKAIWHCLTDLDCLDCPYVDYEGKERCDEKVLNDLCDLINRQKAKIKASQMDNKQLETDNLNANMNCEHLQAEIERLQNILLKFMDEVAKWEAKKGIDVSELPLIPICDEGRDIIDHYRATAIKEFAERLSEKAPHITEERFLILQNEIDNLVKEMAGEIDV